MQDLFHQQYHKSHVCFFVLSGHHPLEDTRRPIRSSILSQVSFDSSVKYPIVSMDGRLTHIWLICVVNVGKYNIHGSYGYRSMLTSPGDGVLSCV